MKQVDTLGDIVQLSQSKNSEMPLALLSARVRCCMVKL